MENQKQGEINFLHKVPDASLRPDLDKIVEMSEQLDAVVAYVTKAGVEMFWEFLQRLNGNATLVSDIQPPTDVCGLIDIAKQALGKNKIFIHMRQGRINNQPFRLLHSKILLSMRRESELADVVVGSHNWTVPALAQGLNAEASTHIVAPKSSEFVRDVRQHILECQKKSKCVDPQNIPGICEISRNLKKKFGSWHKFPEVKKHATTVIHVEAELERLREEPHLTVYINLKGREDLGQEFEFDGNCDLWVYKPGTLHGHTPPLPPPPILFEGTCTMLNNVDSGTVATRIGINSEITELEQPILKYLTAGDLAARDGVQIVLDVRRSKIHDELPMYFESMPRVITHHEEANVEREFVSEFPRRTALLESAITRLRDADEPPDEIITFEPKLKKSVTAKMPMREKFYAYSVKNELSQQSSALSGEDLKVKFASPKARSGAREFFYRAKYFLKKR